MEIPSGILNFDKPPSLSSARAVAQVKRLLPRKTKIGHAGTLDPFATGVLLLLVGQATKQCERLMDQPKQYEATIKLGATTATDDPESPEQPWRVGDTGLQPVNIDKECHGLKTRATPDAVREALPRFIGQIQQRPPTYSALKIAGRRAYDLARKGQEVKIEPRTVQVYGIELLEYSWPLLRLRIDCGRGAYIRAIARDLGEVLDVGGHLTALRRTRIGNFKVEESVTLKDLNEQGVARFLRS